MNELHPESVRGHIKRYLAKTTEGARARKVVEHGSLLPGPHAWWADNRHLCPDAEWIGVDAASGYNVDIVLDIENEVDDRMYGCDILICSEVLEHVRHPPEVLARAYETLAPGGLLVLTTLTAFPIHNFPSDYWRFTPEGLKLLMLEAGFHHVSVESAAEFEVTLTNIGGPAQRFRVPIHVFGSARKPGTLPE